MPSRSKGEHLVFVIGVGQALSFPRSSKIIPGLNSGETKARCRDLYREAHRRLQLPKEMAQGSMDVVGGIVGVPGNGAVDGRSDCRQGFLGVVTSEVEVPFKGANGKR